MNYAAVAGAGALGAMLRLFIGQVVPVTPFPWATLIINVTGSFILGWFMVFVGERAHIPEHVRLAVSIGFVGAYTTFSTYMHETDKLWAKNSWLALAYLAGSIILGLTAIKLGAALAQ